jgi:hypothetical protein
MDIAAIIISSIVLLVAIITLIKVSNQTELLRKQVFGELYNQAQINDLQFYLPEKQKHVVEGFEQKEDAEVLLGKYISIPLGSERELHVRWKMLESQTLRSFTVGFHDKGSGQSYSFKNKPEITDIIGAFIKKPQNLLPREEYIDWHGFYHCEYGHTRRFSKNDYFVSSLKVKGRQKGKYTLNVEIHVVEAPSPFIADLEVECK